MIFATLPLWLTALFVVVVPTAAMMAGTYYVRRWVGFERLNANNEVAGFKFATIGVIYAVLLAFAVIVVWERFSSAEDHVAAEAGAAATIYRLAASVEGEPGAALVSQKLTAYVEAAVTRDWESMEYGKADEITTRAIAELYSATLAYKPADLRGATLLAELLRQIDDLTAARRARIVKSAGAVPGVLWFVLFTGAFVTVGFTFFFGNENVLAQSVMTGALCVLVFSGLFVIVTIDRPFAGVIKVHPEALHKVLTDLGPHADKSAPEKK